MHKILLVGTGNVGGHIVELLAREPRPIELFVADVNRERAELLVNNALIGGAHHDLHPAMHARHIDLNDIDATAELISEIAPSVVINCTVMHTWHLIRKLPQDIYEKLSSATLGAWLPVQLTLPYKLALAIQASGVKTHFINTSLSDLTNPVLGKVGLAPTVGIGNVDLIAPAIQTLVSREREVPRQEIGVQLVTHHQHWVAPREAGYAPDAPYFLKVTRNGEDITPSFDTDKLMFDAVKLYPPGIEFTLVSASSTVKNMFGLLSEEQMETHAPGPLGLPGGYPVRLSSEGAEVVIPEGLTLQEAVQINEAAQRLDGVESIEADGTVVFADYAVEIMKEVLGFDCETFTPEESEERARELIGLYRELEQKVLNGQ